MTTKKSEDQLYKSLGIDSSASKADIKKAFRTLAKIHHPDVGGEPRLFREIEHAYAILSDPAKREAYDNGEDPDGIQGRDERIKDIVTSIFTMIIADRFVADHEDLVSRMDAMCNERRLNCMKAIETYECTLRGYKTILNRIKDGDIIKAHMKREISAIEKMLEGYNRDITDLHEASEIISKFEYEHEEDTELIGAIENERKRINS